MKNLDFTIRIVRHLAMDETGADKNEIFLGHPVMGDQHKHILAHLETEFHQNFKPGHLAEICCWSNVRGHMSQFVQGVNFLNPKLLIMRSIWIRQKYDMYQ